MENKEGLKLILEEALKTEEKAEQNCNSILHELRINGFHNVIEHIKNDEAHHQEMVKRLLTLLV